MLPYFHIVNHLSSYLIEEAGSPSARKALNVKTGAGGGAVAASPGSPSKTKDAK
jgi:hypothetical protein